jgi:hypothetical protein
VSAWLGDMAQLRRSVVLGETPNVEKSSQKDAAQTVAGRAGLAVVAVLTWTGLWHSVVVENGE